MSFETIKYVITETINEWREDKGSRLAAALSYYTIFSLPPLLVISLAVAARFFDRQQARQQVLALTSEWVGQTGREAVAQILENAADPALSSLAAVVSLVLLFFGASAVFSELQGSMNQIWDVEAKPGRGILGTIKDRLFSFALVIAVGLLLVVFLLLSTLITAFGQVLSDVLPGLMRVASVFNFLISWAGVTALFALVFKYVPDVEISWRDVWLGAVVTAVLFNIGKWGISYYMGRSVPASAYGAAGSLIVLLLWVYYSAQIFFVGAEFTQVYANRFGEQIVADQDAIPAAS